MFATSKQTLELLEFNIIILSRGVAKEVSLLLVLFNRVFHTKVDYATAASTCSGLNAELLRVEDAEDVFVHSNLRAGRAFRLNGRVSHVGNGYRDTEVGTI